MWKILEETHPNEKDSATRHRHVLVLASVTLKSTNKSEIERDGMPDMLRVHNIEQCLQIHMNITHGQRCVLVFCISA